MIAAAESKLQDLFEILQVDYRNDHNTRGTPARVARMLVAETMSGRYCEPPDITDFENVKEHGNLIVTGPIELRSTCAHHMLPIYGHAVIGIHRRPTGGSSAYPNTTASSTTSPRACRSRRNWSSRSESSSWNARRRAASPSG